MMECAILQISVGYLGIQTTIAAKNVVLMTGKVAIDVAKKQADVSLKAQGELLRVGQLKNDLELMLQYHLML